MTHQREAHLTRQTSESSIDLSLNLDGTGRADIDTSVPFFDHLLTAFSKHSLIDLTVRAHGDTQIDVHHTVEDTGIVLGKALAQALGDKAGIYPVRRRPGSPGRSARASRRRRVRSPLPGALRRTGRV